MSDEKSIIEKVSEKREKEKKKEEARQQLLDKVDGWLEEGWEVSHLERKVKGDLEKGKELIDEYEEKIRRLKKIKDKYQSLPLDDFNFDTSRIESNLNDPDAVKKLERWVSQLKKNIEKIKRKRRKKKKAKKERKRLMKKAKEWKEEDYDVDELIDLLKKDIVKGKKKFEEYKENIDELELLRKKYYSLDMKGQNFDTIEIEHKLNDPMAVDELREKIENLGKRSQPEIQTGSKQEVSSRGPEKTQQTQQTQDVFTLDSKEDWSEILEEQRRNEDMFQEIRRSLKDKEELEEELVDYLQTDEDLRENFLYYMEYWNKNISEEEEAKYFRHLDEDTDYKLIKIYSTSPVIGCLYGIAALLEEEKIGISKSTRPHLFFKEYVDKLYGEKSEELKDKEENNNDIYYF